MTFKIKFSVSDNHVIVYNIYTHTNIAYSIFIFKYYVIYWKNKYAKYFMTSFSEGNCIKIKHHYETRE